jgi:serine phosphatase RsbU (regulator of sigma subunit)
MSLAADFGLEGTLFADLPGPLLVEIGRTLKPVEAAPGTVIFNQGDPADAIYLISEGTVVISAEGFDLLQLSRGELVGEVALLDERLRSASATAGTAVRLLKWERDDFHKLMQAPELALALFKVLTRKLRQDLPVKAREAATQQDLRRAREIQKAMLPAGGLATPRAEVAGSCRPCDDVGGDFYDYLDLGDGKVGAIICDVQGHGFNSALMVSLVKGVLDTQRRFDHAPASILGSMNHALELSARTGLLMSCCYALVDAERGTLSYSNAGHPAPFVFDSRAGELRALESTDMILGVVGFPRAGFPAVEIPFRSGDVLVLYSDGVTEALDQGGSEFGAERLGEILRSEAKRPAAEIQNEILAAHGRHCGKVRVADDVTLVVVKAL